MKIMTSQTREYVVSTLNAKGQGISEAQQHDALRERIKADGVKEWTPLDDEIISISADYEVHLYRIRVDEKWVTI